MKNIYVTKPFLPSLDEFNVQLKKIWDIGILTNNGPLHEEFKEKLSIMCSSNISLFANGHMALETAIKAMEFPIGSEIITTPFTFVSTTHAIINNGLIPVFCDIKLTDYTIDESKIESLITDKTCAILAVHVYGHPCNVEKIEEIAKKNNLKVIYDAAHAFDVEINNESLLKHGDVSMVSFHATKLFHTIEGGMLACNDNEMIRKINIMKNFGITGPETVEFIGINAKMNEIQAAMGLTLLPHLEEIVNKRCQLYNLYKKELFEIEGIKLVELPNNIKYNYAYLPILINEKYSLNRDELCKLLEQNNIYSRKYFSPCTNEFECYKGKYKNDNLKNSEYVSKRIITLPLYPDLSIEDVEKICSVIREGLEK